MNRTVKIDAVGTVEQATLGGFKYFYVRTATNPFQISFNGSDWITANINDTFGPLKPEPTRVFFKSLGILSSTVGFDYGDQPFAAQSTSQKEASTYPVVTTGNPYTLAGNPGQLIPGKNNGNQRKMITFFAPGTGDSYQICTADGTVITTMTGGQLTAPVIAPSQPIAWPTDHDYKVKKLVGNAVFQIYEIYYLNQ